MFQVNEYGRLFYHRRGHFELPRVVRVYQEEDTDYPRAVEVPRTRRDGSLIENLPLYKLEWPDEVTTPQEIPTEWLTLPAQRDRGYRGPDLGEGNASARHSLSDLVRQDCLPVEDCDPLIVKHLAANRELYFSREVPDDTRSSLVGEPRPTRLEVLDFPYNLNGIAPAHVSAVFDASFALDEGYLPAIKYLKWIAETHWPHPLLSGFDTMVRDHLLNRPKAAVDDFFFMLGDRYFQPDRNYEVSALWRRLARYYFWTRNTGGGLVWRYSDLENSRLQNVYPEVIEFYEAWDVRTRDRRHLADYVEPPPEHPDPVEPETDAEPETDEAPAEPEPDEVIDLRRSVGDQES